MEENNFVRDNNNKSNKNNNINNINRNNINKNNIRNNLNKNNNNNKYNYKNNKYHNLNKKTSLKDMLMNISLFVLVLILIITTIFTLDKLFLNEPENNCTYIGKTYVSDNSDVNYDEVEIEKCYDQEGQVIYNNDGTIDCDFCNRDWRELNDDYRQKTSWFRIILGFLFSVIFTLIALKDKILKSALVVGSLLSLIFATIFSLSYINDKLFPIIIILELILVIFIFKKFK